MISTYIPYLQVPKGSRIILYGAGENGLKVYKQLHDSLWCTILSVVDKNYLNIQDFPIKIESPETIIEKNGYNFVLVTITSEHIAQSVENYLISLGVKHNKILLGYKFYAHLPAETKVTNTSPKKDEKLRIMLLIKGSMGDFVMSLKLYEAIAKCAPNSVIDIFGGDLWFEKHVFFNLPNLGKIVKKPNKAGFYDYDVYLSLRFAVHIDKVNFKRVRMLEPDFAKKLEYLYELDKKNFVDLHVFQYENRILLDRARLLGLNRYTLMDRGGIFGIKDKQVILNIADGAEEEFRQLNLKKTYITFNYGAAVPLKEAKAQTKQWLPEYHVQLNKLLKDAFPEIEIVQIGSKDVKIINGADRYIIGENLEVSKCVLKHSLCHFDCEGGLVHIATQLRTKCFVVFGPTPAWFLGYEQNTNIIAEECGECKGLIEDWYTRCIKGFSPPACMASIKPERVFKLMKEYIEENHNN